MKLAIMQPYFFPYIGYWQLINTVDKFIIYDDVNYIKGGWINRNRILMNGNGKLINLPIRQASQNKRINEIEVLKDSTISFLSIFNSCAKRGSESQNYGRCKSCSVCSR